MYKYVNVCINMFIHAIGVSTWQFYKFTYI